MKKISFEESIKRTVRKNSTNLDIMIDREAKRESIFLYISCKVYRTNSYKKYIIYFKAEQFKKYFFNSVKFKKNSVYLRYIQYN